ncbi:MAG: triple tyrosine motif-containing protein [Bacteroidetes bacterium]|nr:triple tyrosine motif-containing protein [Bacteroidota bacterium]
MDFEEARISCLFEDDLGNLWVGTRSGRVARIDPDRLQASYFSHQPDNKNSLLDGTRIMMFYQDRFGRIWIGLDNGVSIYDPDKKCFLNSIMDSILGVGITKRWVNSIMEDKQGRIWLNIDVAGLLRVVQKEKDHFSFKLFSTNDGLNGLTIGGMAADPNGEFWLINYGLLHINPFDESFQLYDHRNGLRQDIGFEESIYIDFEGNLFIGGEGKFETRNIKDLNYPSTEIKLVLESVEINGKILPVVYKSASEKKLVLKGDDNNLIFHFGVICFTDADQLLFRYKLAGFDKDWVAAGSSREVRYGSLPPGRYQFLFSVLNRGVWIDYQKPIILIIRPYFYKTWWFLTLCISILFLLGYLLIRNRFRQILKMERLRTRIATDLHDEVGSTLTSISILSEILGNKMKNTPDGKMIAEIHGSARKILEGIDDIIWLVNPTNDVFRNLELRIREYAIPLFESRNIDFNIHFDEKLSAVQLPMDVRRNIYLITKEAINNLIKYSQCTRADIHFTEYAGGFEMSVTDNGTGFDPEIQTGRNGLKNMRLRAEKIRGSLVINASPGRGSQIILKLKTI